MLAYSDFPGAKALTIPWTTDAALSRAASLGPEQPAAVLSEDGTSISYGELDNRATRLANAFATHSVGSGDHSTADAARTRMVTRVTIGNGTLLDLQSKKRALKITVDTK